MPGVGLQILQPEGAPHKFMREEKKNDAETEASFKAWKEKQAGSGCGPKGDGGGSGSAPPQWCKNWGELWWCPPPQRTLVKKRVRALVVAPQMRLRLKPQLAKVC